MNKRILSLIISLCIIMGTFCTMPSGVFAANIASGVAGDNITWVLDSDGTLTFTGTGDMNDTNPWIYYYENIINVVIGEGITYISNEAFDGCEFLETVKIPHTVMCHGSSLFYGCPLGTVTIYGYTGNIAEELAAAFGYTFVSLGDAPDNILASGVFGNTDNLTWKFSSLGVLTIGGTGSMGWFSADDAPWNDYSKYIRSAVIEDGVTQIISEAFYNLERLEKIQITPTITEIYYGTFDNCYFLWQIIGYEDTAAQVFAEDYGYDFVSLGKVPVLTIASGSAGDNITYTLDNYGTLTFTGTGDMKKYSYYNATPWYEKRELIENVVVSEGITSLSSYAMYDADNLVNVTLPETLTKIGKEVFCGCSSLESVTVHHNVKEIGNNAFYGTVYGFKIKGYTGSYAELYAESNYITFESIGTAPKYTVASGTCGTDVSWVFDSYRTLTLTGTGDTMDLESYSSSTPPWNNYKGLIKRIVIDSGVTGIGEYLFKDCYMLADVEIADTVTKIGSNAFHNCSEFKTITIPASVTSIGPSAFSGCADNFVIKGYTPSDAEEYAKNNSYTFEVLGTLPIEVIASGSCGQKLTWTLDNYGLLKIEGTGDMSFDSTQTGGGTGGDVSVELLSATSTSMPWYSYRNRIKKLEICYGVTSIEDYAFYNCTKLTEATLGESLKSIGRSSFANCTNLGTITLHWNVSNIGSYAFNQISNLVIKGYKNSYAEEYANKSYISFESIGDMPVAVVDSGAVNDKISWSLDNYGLLKIWGEGAMPRYESSSDLPWLDYMMSDIKSVEIRGVDVVYENTFENCHALKTVVVDGVKCVYSYAFSSCNYITDITIGADMRLAGWNAFGYLDEENTIKGMEGTYAELYAEKFGCKFEKIDGEVNRDEIYVSTVDELISAIGSNRTIILKDGVYVLDKSSYLGDKEYTWEYADTIRIDDVINLTIKAENPGMAEIISSQTGYLNYNSHQNAPFSIFGAYNLVFDGVRIGNMKMNANNGYNVKGDEIQLLGGYDENALGGFGGAYITNSENKGNKEYADMYSPVTIQNKVSFINCDIFNCAYGIVFNGLSLTVDNCTIRDNAKGAIYSYANTLISDTTFSRNGNNAAYEADYCLTLGKDSKVENCTFINNGNDAFISCENLTESGNRFADNGWDNKDAKAYGITKNNITWEVCKVDDANVLKLGYDITSDGVSFQSATGTVYPYTVNSAPWREFKIDRIDMASGVDYANIIYGGCGENVTWQFVPETKTLTISGNGSMSDIYSDYMWSAYNNSIENIVIENTVTGVYNNFAGTKFYGDKANWDNGSLYIGDVLVKANYEATGVFTVKDGTRVIADEAFYNIDGITEVVLPESVKYIGVTEIISDNEFVTDGVFANCSSLTSIKIPASVKEFDHAMLYNCEKMTDIYYSGTMAEWSKISMGKNNKQISLCTVHCKDGMISSNPYVYDIDCYREGDEVIYVQTDMKYVSGNEKLYVSGCTADDKVVSVACTSDGKYVRLNGTKAELDTISFIKVYVWENTKSLRPLARPVKVLID